MQPATQPKTDPPPAKRFCVQFRQMTNGEKPKTKVFHNFFNAIDEAGAEQQFWATPTWKPPVRRIEIVSIEAI